jgi:hypothetical protein
MTMTTSIQNNGDASAELDKRQVERTRVIRPATLLSTEDEA